MDGHEGVEEGGARGAQDAGPNQALDRDAKRDDAHEREEIRYTPAVARGLGGQRASCGRVARGRPDSFSLSLSLQLPLSLLWSRYQ